MLQSAAKLLPQMNTHHRLRHIESLACELLRQLGSARFRPDRPQLDESLRVRLFAVLRREARQVDRWLNGSPRCYRSFVCSSARASAGIQARRRLSRATRHCMSQRLPPIVTGARTLASQWHGRAVRGSVDVDWQMSATPPRGAEGLGTHLWVVWLRPRAADRCNGLLSGGLEDTLAIWLRRPPRNFCSTR